MIILQDEIQEKLNRCRFSGLEDIAVGDALHYFGGYRPDEKYCRLKVRLRTVTTLLISRLDVQTSGSGRIIFVYSYPGRQDYFEWFRKVCALAENKTLFLPGERKYTLKRLHYRKHLRQWKSQMKEKGFGRLERRIYALSILQSAVKLWDIEAYIREKQIDPSLVMVACDTHAEDSMIVQRFNARKTDTACLQHGNFEVSCESWLMEGSQSRYYLVYGEYTKRQFLKCGHAAAGLLPVGMPGLIGGDIPDKMSGSEEPVFGVILNGAGPDDSKLGLRHDIELVHMAESLAQKTGLKYCELCNKVTLTGYTAL